MHAQLTARRTNGEDVDATGGFASFELLLSGLGRAVTSEQVARAIVQAGRMGAGAQGGAVVELTPDRRSLEVLYAFGDFAPGLIRDRQVPLSAMFPLCDVVRSRQSMWLTDPEELRARYPDLTPAGSEGALAVLPLEIDSIILGAVGWSFQQQRLGAYERACLRSVAKAGGMALYRAGLFDSEQHARTRLEFANYDAVKRDRMMSSVSATLDSLYQSGSTPTALDQIACLTLPRLGQWCTIYTVDEHERLQLAAGTQYDLANESAVRHVRASAWAGHRLPGALRKHNVLIADLRNASTRTTGFTERQLQGLRTVGIEHLLILPLRIHGRTLGLISFGTGGGSPAYNDTDVALADRVARRCASWLEYLQLRDFAERADRARETFVAAASHELRTPLSHIKGFVSTLLTSDWTVDASTRADFLVEVEREADRLAQLIDTLLDLARIDVSGLDGARRPARPVDLVAAGVERIGPSLNSRTLDIRVPADLPSVWAYSSNVERAISNLLDNAAKYSPPDSPIVIGARRLSRRSVMFRFEDRGPGIPPEDRERIFEPFFREPTGPYTAKPGSGLGLAICRSIIRAHHGRIWVEPRSGGGTVFAFTLPIAVHSAAA